MAYSGLNTQDCSPLLFNGLPVLFSPTFTIGGCSFETCLCLKSLEGGTGDK